MKTKKILLLVAIMAAYMLFSFSFSYAVIKYPKGALSDELKINIDPSPDPPFPPPPPKPMK